MDCVAVLCILFLYLFCFALLAFCLLKFSYLHLNPDLVFPMVFPYCVVKNYTLLTLI